MTSKKLFIIVFVFVSVFHLCQTRHFHFNVNILEDVKKSQPNHNSTLVEPKPSLLPRFRMETRKHRLRRSIGSVKLQGYLTQKLEQDQAVVPPTFVALVFIDVIAAIFTFNVIAALLFVANH